MDNKIVLIIVAILLPPLAIFLKQKSFGMDLIINIILCIFFWLPGIIHALYICLMK